MNIAMETADTVSSLRTQKGTRQSRALELLAFVLVWFLLSGLSLAGESATLTIEGSGEVAVVPDQADITVSFQERGWDVSKLESQMNGKVDKLIAALLKTGIGQNSIDSTQVRIMPVSRYDQVTKRQIPEGFELTRSVTIRVVDIDSLGTTLAVVTDQQISQVSSPRLSFSEHEMAYQQALAKAVEQAQARAAVIAEASGLELGAIVKIATPGNPLGPMPEGRLAMAASDVGNYTPGEMLITASLSITFSLDSP